MIHVSANPTRAELRIAVQNLRALSSVIPSAAAELARVEELAKSLYPRGGIPAGAFSQKRGGRRRRLIEARDCAYPCPCCRGKRGRVLPTATIICPECRGTGVAYGLPQVRVQIHESGPEFIYRGPMDSSGMAARILPIGTMPHRRGFAGGRMIGPMTAAESAVLESWRGVRVNPGACDVAAELEAAACRTLKAAAGRKPRNRRKMGSNRDRQILTPGQERRSRMADRVATCQSIYNRVERARERAENPPFRLAGERALKSIGIDVAALKARLRPPVPVKPPVAESDRLLNEAIRRGDIPRA